MYPLFLFLSCFCFSSTASTPKEPSQTTRFTAVKLNSRWTNIFPGCFIFLSFSTGPHYSLSQQRSNIYGGSGDLKYLSSSLLSRNVKPIASNPAAQAKSHKNSNDFHQTLWNLLFLPLDIRYFLHFFLWDGRFRCKSTTLIAVKVWYFDRQQLSSIRQNNELEKRLG